MTIRIPRRISPGLSRRRFLSSAAATGAGAIGAIAMPYLSAPPTGRWSPMACNPAISAPMAAWCGRAPTGRRK